MAATADAPEREAVLRFFNPAGRGMVTQIDAPPTEPLQPLDEGAQRIVSARRRGLVHPAEILTVLAPERRAPGGAIPPGEFVEHDLDDTVAGRGQPPRATNKASIVVGLVRTGPSATPRGCSG